MLEKENLDVLNEPTEVVSNEEVTQVVTEEWKAPSKEDYEVALKSASNRAKTEILKELGVNSIKEFKTREAERGDLESQLETIRLDHENVQKRIEEVLTENNTLKQHKVLTSLNVQEDYINDIIKLASEQVTDEKPFEVVAKELIEGRYKYTVGVPSVKMGSEKTKVDDISTASKDLQKKYPWIK